MTTTNNDDAEKVAEGLLPCYSALHGTIAGAICPCDYRDDVAAALRTAREEALEEAAKIAESEYADDSWHQFYRGASAMIARQIRAASGKE